MTIQVLTPEGRLVNGHPMISNVVTDDRTKQPKLGADGLPRKETFIAVAIPKAGTVDWKTTEWGAQIVAAAQAAWPQGQFNTPTFAWKVEDGDSQVPNKRGKKNCDREGYPGHWIIKGQTGLPIRCYHAGYYDPTQQIQDQNAIKPGDYCRVMFNVKGNDSADSPGVYMNPALFELSRAGELIVLDSGPSAAEVFGGAGGVPQQPAGAVPGAAPPAAAPTPQTAAPAGIQPAPDFLQGGAAPTAPAAPAAPGAPAEEMYYDQNGAGPFAKSVLAAAGYTEAHFATLRRA